MKYFYLLIVNLLSFVSLCQTGTVGDPFTTLYQAAFVKTAGTYHFNITGTTFSTHIDNNGYVQIAIDFGNGSGNLPQSTSLNTSTRGILTPTILSKLTETGEVRITSSTGNIDVLTTNATIVSRVINNATIHQGSPDNAINDSWTGTNAIFLTEDATNTTNRGFLLHENIFHPRANPSTFHWIPSNTKQREQSSSGQIAVTEYFQLWVRENTSPLPIRLLKFDATLNDNKRVQLSWSTAAEINNDYFSIESSIDGENWKEVFKEDGAGNSSSVIEYLGTDNNPIEGISYYRLKQVDFDGEYSYSKVEVINFENSNTENIKIYPNPFSNQLTIQGNKDEIEGLRLYNVFGVDVSNKFKIVHSNNDVITIDVSRLKSGIYLLKTKTELSKIFKK